MASAIDRLTLISDVNDLSDSDKVAAYNNSLGDDVKIPLSVLREFLGLSASSNTFVTQHSAPASTGLTISVTGTTSNVMLFIRPSAGYAAMTIKMPASSTCVDGQQVRVYISQQVTTLSFNINGANSIDGEPSALGADDFFTLQFDKDNLAWVRVA